MAVEPGIDVAALIVRIGREERIGAVEQPERVGGGRALAERRRAKAVNGRCRGPVGRHAPLEVVRTASSASSRLVGPGVRSYHRQPSDDVAPPESRRAEQRDPACRRCRSHRRRWPGRSPLVLPAEPTVRGGIVQNSSVSADAAVGPGPMVSQEPAAATMATAPRVHADEKEQLSRLIEFQAFQSLCSQSLQSCPGEPRMPCRSPLSGS